MIKKSCIRCNEILVDMYRRGRKLSVCCECTRYLRSIGLEPEGYLAYRGIQKNGLPVEKK